MKLDKTFEPPKPIDNIILDTWTKAAAVGVISCQEAREYLKLGYIKQWQFDRLFPESKLEFAEIVKDDRLVHTVDLGGRVSIVISRGKLSNYIAEIYPFKVSWPLNSDSDDAALAESKELSKNYLQNLVDSIK